MDLRVIARLRRRLGLSLRTKVLLLSSLLLAVPYVGYQYVRQMEAFLREGLEASVMGAARALAGALHERPDLLAAGERQAGSEAEDLYVYRIDEPLQACAQPAD